VHATTTSLLMRTPSKLCGALAVFALTSIGAVASVRADDLPCVSTTFRWMGPNDRVCVSVFDDPKVPGVACHISQARTGGVKGGLGLAEDPPRFSIACRQVGPISADLSSLADKESVYSERTSVFFKSHQGLSHRRQAAKHARLPGNQQQDRRGLAAERGLDRADHALGALTNLRRGPSEGT
jgi:catabolite regulation protein CreA